MSEWKGKKSEPGFMGLNDSPDSKTKKSNKSLNQKNHNLSRLVGSSDSEWKEYKLGELVEVKSGKRLPKGELLVDYDTGHPYIRVTDLGRKWIKKDGLQFVLPKIQKRISKYIVNKGDVILSIVGSIGLTGRISSELDNANLTENCIKFALKSDALDNDYLYYFLFSRIGQEEIEKRNVGSTQPKLPIYNIKDIDIQLPNINEQLSIASILSSLDDKIDLLHRQNKTLEQLAETLFRQWFVVEADNSWEIDLLGNLYDIGIGRTPPRKEQQWFSKNNNDIKWISIKDMNFAGIYIDSTSEYLTKEAVEKFSVPIIPENTVILSFKMTIGRLAITTERMLSNEAIAHFKQKEKSLLFPEYLYLFLKTYKFDLLGSTSSIVESINSQMIKEMEITIPTEIKLKGFENLIKPYFQKIQSNQFQIHTLTKLRDTLLPKLMSGEIRIKA